MTLTQDACKAHGGSTTVPGRPGRGDWAWAGPALTGLDNTPTTLLATERNSSRKVRPVRRRRGWPVPLEPGGEKGILR